MAERPDRRARRSVRTAVVWEVLQQAVSDRASAAGRDALDVVDVGGGTGGFAVPLAELGHHVTVVDPSPDALAALERRAAEAGVGDHIRAIQGDTAGLLDVVGEATVDLALCHGVLEHVDEPSEAIAALVAVLRPQATVSVLAANRTAVVVARALTGRFLEALHALDDPAGRWGDADPVPRRFTDDELRGLLRDAGLHIQDVHGIRIFSDLVPGALVDLEPGAAEALLRLEEAVATNPAFAGIAAQIHVLATGG